jgi:transposase-like protein
MSREAHVRFWERAGVRLPRATRLPGPRGNDGGARRRGRSTTIWRWIQHYAPRLEKEIRWYQGHTSGSWRVDETCIRVNGEWKWLFRAVDQQGRTVDFLLTHRRNAKAARHFLAKALRTRQDWPPHLINRTRTRPMAKHCGN